MIVLAIEGRTYKIIDFDDDMDMAVGCVCMSKDELKKLREDITRVLIEG